MISSNLLTLCDDFQGILLDAYGVFWAGNEFGLLPGAKETMEQLVSRDKIVGILSNSTQLASKEIAKYHQHGLIQGKHFHFFVTSGEVAKEVVSKRELPFPTPRNAFWILSGDHPKFSSHQAIFQDSIYRETAHLDEADFIYISIPHRQGEDQTDPEMFRSEIEAIKRTNLPMLCANPDRFAQEGNPPQLVVRQGSMASMYESLGGTVFYLGKPHPHAYAAAMRHFEHYHISNPAHVLMVGDTPETDIRGARRFGMSSALLTQTGIMGDRIQHQGQAAIDALPPHDQPTFFLQRL